MSRLVHTVIGIFCLLALCSTGYGATKVLIVHSYHAEYDWIVQINKGIERAMPQGAYELKFHYMDTKRRSDETWKISAGQKAMLVCNTYAPDIVIACDDNAQAYFASELSRQPDGPQIVFCGVNNDHKMYGYPNDKATGILERPHVTSTLRLAQSLKPAIKKVTVLCDQSATGEQIIAYCKSLKMPVTITQYVTTENFQQWQAQVRKANTDSDAILVVLYHTIKSSSMETDSMEPRSVMAWTRRHSRIPLLGLYPFTVEDGAVLAISASPMEHGYLAARMALDLLQTKMKASRFKVNTAVEGLIMFNLPSAKRYQFNIPPHLLKMARHIVQQDNVQQASGKMPTSP